MADNPIDINSIPFGNIIGGPLAACVSAQAEAAETTSKYIYETLMNDSELGVGNMNPKTISFTFVLNGETTKMVVPLLTIVPVPYMRIESVDLSFSAEITENDEKKMLAKYTSPHVESNSENTTQTEFRSLINIDIHATTANMPSGMAKLLEVFSNQLVQVEELTPERVDELRWQKLAETNTNIAYRPLTDINGMTPEVIERLKAAGIKTVGQFLARGYNPTGRRGLARIANKSTSDILIWCNYADMMRINGVGSNLAVLLEASGVDTVKELRQRTATNLEKALKDTNDKRNLVKRLPVKAELEKFISMAKSLDGTLIY